MERLCSVLTMLEESFGIIPLRKNGADWEVFLIQHRDGHWGFPKGHADTGETAFQTAVRELKEETGLSVAFRLNVDPCVERYAFTKKDQRIEKQVTYFICEVVGEVHLQQSEVQKGLWTSFEQAFSHLTYAEGKAILRETLQKL